MELQKNQIYIYGRVIQIVSYYIGSEIYIIYSELWCTDVNVTYIYELHIFL